MPMFVTLGQYEQKIALEIRGGRGGRGGGGGGGGKRAYFFLNSSMQGLISSWISFQWK